MTEATIDRLAARLSVLAAASAMALRESVAVDMGEALDSDVTESSATRRFSVEVSPYRAGDRALAAARILKRHLGSEDPTADHAINYVGMSSRPHDQAHRVIRIPGAAGRGMYHHFDVTPRGLAEAAAEPKDSTYQFKVPGKHVDRFIGDMRGSGFAAHEAPGERRTAFGVVRVTHKAGEFGKFVGAFEKHTGGKIDANRLKLHLHEARERGEAFSFGSGGLHEDEGRYAADGHQWHHVGMTVAGGRHFDMTVEARGRDHAITLAKKYADKHYGKGYDPVIDSDHEKPQARTHDVDVGVNRFGRMAFSNY